MADVFAGTAHVAFAALALALGAQQNELDELWGYLKYVNLPDDPAEAAEQMHQAIEAIRSPWPS